MVMIKTLLVEELQPVEVEEVPVVAGVVELQEEVHRIASLQIVNHRLKEEVEELLLRKKMLSWKMIMRKNYQCHNHRMVRKEKSHREK
jgi:hypothetical protein